MRFIPSSLSYFRHPWASCCFLLLLYTVSLSFAYESGSEKHEHFPSEYVRAYTIRKIVRGIGEHIVAIPSTNNRSQLCKSFEHRGESQTRLWSLKKKRRGKKCNVGGVSNNVAAWNIRECNIIRNQGICTFMIRRWDLIGKCWGALKDTYYTTKQNNSSIFFSQRDPDSWWRAWTLNIFQSRKK